MTAVEMSVVGQEAQVEDVQKMEEGVRDMEEAKPNQMMEIVLEGEHEAEGKGGNPVVKIIKYAIAAPVFLVACVISLLLLVVWILLMPIKCCCPGGSIVGCLEKIMGCAAKMPMQAVKKIIG